MTRIGYLNLGGKFHRKEIHMKISQLLATIIMLIALGLLVIACAPIDSFLSESSTQSRSNSMFTPLNLAVKEGDLETVSKLLAEGANPNEGANYGSGEEILVGNLSLAVNYIEDPLAMLKLLLEAGASPINDFMAMKDAIERGNLEVVDLMVQYGADVNLGLDLAVMFDQTEITQMFLQYGADPNQGVSTAKLTYNVDMLQLLINAGATVETLPREQTHPEDYIRDDNGSLIRIR